MKQVSILCFIVLLISPAIFGSPVEEHEHHEEHAEHSEHSEHLTHEGHEGHDAHKHHHHLGENNAAAYIAEHKITCPYAIALIESRGKLNVTEDVVVRAEIIREFCTKVSEQAKVDDHHVENLKVYKEYIGNEALTVNDAFKVFLLSYELHDSHSIHDKAKTAGAICSLITKH